MKVSELQEKILSETGIKTSVKKASGSMKDYLIFSPMFQNGSYPQFPFEWRQNLLKEYPETEPVTISVGSTQIHLHKSIISGEPTKYKTERKPKPIDPDRPVKGWGSKNSQLRLDKAAARYGKALRRGENRATYY